MSYITVQILIQQSFFLVLIFAILYAVSFHHPYSSPTLEPNKGTHRTSGVDFHQLCVNDIGMIYLSKHVMDLHYSISPQPTPSGNLQVVLHYYKIPRARFD